MGSFYNPVKVLINRIDEIERVLINLGSQVKNIVLLTRGEDFLDSLSAHTLMKCLENFNVKHLQVGISNPDIEDLFHYYSQIKNVDFHCIIGVGGGTILDLSKSLSALKHIEIDSTNQLRLLIKQKSYVENQNIVPWIGIPTTSGTGSELTCWATIWDRAKGVKLSIESENLYAHTAIIDSTLTTSLPKKLTASTALDALCHATEAYWSKNSNELSKVYALEAIKRIVGNLEKVLDCPYDLTLRNEMALGSLYAGLAFSNTRTTACHSISYPLTLYLGIDHGVATSLTLAKIMELNLETIIDKNQLFEAFGVANIEEVKQFIIHIYEQAGFPSNLKDYNANLEIIESIVENAFTKGRMDNNPIALTKKDVLSVLMSIF
ncbi:phosphonoacetaldehyde reductase [Bacillus sp. SD088]|uniref:phosphonoacetaldehyde reductase n=1 Tax=Bacillus sp. SD088 TaxID=2782012 RepID=UPI001A9733CE|nr:phosphonoacetaldehyde reductase [Bacillus sp. SD088]MBO0991501.1 phosphonoacetaldehyde reductase [Bacillus sp. SD088]